MKGMLARCSLLALSISATTGLRIPFKRAAGTKALFGVSDDAGAILANNVGNVKDRRYTATVKLNGKDVTLILDTGSSDLWVYDPEGLGTVNDTNIPSAVLYGDGSYGVNGTIALAPLEFGPYKVEKQAFLDVHQISVTGVTELGIHGLMGLGFNGTRASRIDREIRNHYGPDATWGQTFLANVFSQNLSAPNFIAIDLARTDDLEDTAGGSFDIGEYDSRYSAIQSAPKLPVYPPDAHSWDTLLDGITVDGKAIQQESGVKGVPSGKAVVALDTGTPTSAFPSKIANAIYAAVPGAVRDPSSHTWILPCNSTANLEFSFGGQTFPVHPLDLSMPKKIEVNDKFYTACVGSFITIDGWSDIYDYLLGDSFLRNTYTVYDFGDYDTATQQTGTPYMQLLSQITPAEAAAEAIDTRKRTLENMPPEISPDQLLKLFTAESEGSETNAANTNTNNKTNSAIELPESWKWDDFKKWALAVVVLLGANLLIGFVLLVLGILRCFRGRGKPAVDNAGKPRYVPVSKLNEGGHNTHSGYRYDTPYND